MKSYKHSTANLIEAFVQISYDKIQTKYLVFQENSEIVISEMGKIF